MATMKLVTGGVLRHPPDGQAAVGPTAGRMAAARGSKILPRA